MTLDFSTHIVEILALLGMLWKVNRALNRVLDMFENFPPHRHVNGHIIFPKHYEPTKQE